MFRNVRYYRLDSSWPESEDALSQSLEEAGFKPCGPLTERSSGWVPVNDLLTSIFLGGAPRQFTLGHECGMDDDNDDGDEPLARLDAEFVLITGTLRMLLGDLKKLLGGFA